MPSLTMPDVGESVTEGTVTRWLKHEGDRVELDEPVVEIETEKVEVEVPSPFEGTLARILVQEGEVAAVGAPLAEFEVAGTTEAQREPAPAGSAGRSDGQRAAAVAPSREAAVTNGAKAAPAGEPRRMRRYSPVVLKLAADHDIDLELVQGTGIEGRVTRQDVMRYLENPVAHTVPPSADAGVVGVSKQAAASKPRDAAIAAPTDASAPSAKSGREDEAVSGEELVALSPTRRTIAARMLQSQRDVPVAWMAVEADVSGLVELRARRKDAFERDEGVPLTFMPFFVRAVVTALRQHRELNATYEDDGAGSQRIRVHRQIHIGIAVAAESGLIVPVVRDADRLSLVGLAHAISDLARKARERSLGIDDVRGTTLTLDNTGAFGSIISQPIVPPGQVAIVTTEAIRRELRVNDDGSFAPRSVMNLCISFDHRALDGAQAGAFMRDVRASLEAIAADAPLS